MKKNVSLYLGFFLPIDDKANNYNKGMKFLPAYNKFYFLTFLMIFCSCVKFEPEAPAPVESNSNSGPKTERELNKTVSKIIQSVASVDVRSGFKISFQKKIPTKSKKLNSNSLMQ